MHGLPQCSYAPVQTGRNPRQAIDKRQSAWVSYANLSNPFEAGSVARACGYAEDILLKQIAEQAQNV